MLRRIFILAVWVFLPAFALAGGLPNASSDDLLKVYAQLRALKGSTQWGVTENMEWRRDAATFKFLSGHLTMAEPVDGHILAAYFEGKASIRVQPPTPALQRQLARFAGGPALSDDFEKAVFFFTDDSATQLQNMIHLAPGGDVEGATQAFGEAQKLYSGSFNGWWDNSRQGNPVMRNMPARMLADLTDPSSKGFFLADFKTRHHGNLIYHISWNRDTLFFPYLANDEEVMLIHYNRGQYYEWLGGFHLADEYTHTNWPEHRRLIAHCGEEKIDAEIRKDNRISATAAMDYEVPGGAVRVLPFNLEGVLRISSALDGQGRKLAVIQEAREMDSDPWVIVPEPAEPGKVYNMKVTYDEESTRDSRIVHQQGDGLFYVTARESWFPSFGAPDDRTHITLHFLSPKRYTFVATGRLVNSTKNKDNYESSWDTDIPLSVVGFNYGDFVQKSQSDATLRVVAYAGREVPNELKGLSADIAMAELAEGPSGNHNIAGENGIAEGGFNTAANAQYAANLSFQSFKLFESIFGELPFKTVSVTEQPIRGYAQSWPTLIFLPYDSLLDATTRHQLHLQESVEERDFYNLVAVHEMAHQWWGHVVGWKTYRDQWLSEGFAEFSASYYARHFQTEKVRAYWDLKRKWLLSPNPSGHRPAEVGPLYLNEQLNAQLEPRNAYFAIYDKGAYVLEMIRMMMEDRTKSEPDERFIDTMHDFVKTYANQNASTADFQRIVEKHMGEPMDWFFNEYVYGTEIPSYNFEYKINPSGDGKSVLQFTLTQSDVSDQFLMRVPIYLTLGKRVVRLGLMPIKGSSTITNQVALPVIPDGVSIDEFHEVLAYEHQ